jgi:hypothetical protein
MQYTTPVSYMGLARDLHKTFRHLAPRSPRLYRPATTTISVKSRDNTGSMPPVSEARNAT